MNMGKRTLCFLEKTGKHIYYIQKNSTGQYLAVLKGLRDYEGDGKNKNGTKFCIEISPLYRTLCEDFKKLKFIVGNWTSF